MNTSSPRVRAALIGAAALTAFGLILPANADGLSSGKDPGGVGSARTQDNPPPGQIDNGNSNGWQCANNHGAGVGNPAQGQCDGSYTDPNTGGNGNNGNGPGSNNGGGKSGTGGAVGG